MRFVRPHSRLFDRWMEIVVALMLSALLVGALPFKVVQAQEPPEKEAFVGTWVGTMDVWGGDLRLPVHIECADDGTLAGFAWSPDTFGEGRTPVSRISVDGDRLILEMDVEGTRFTGTLGAEGASIDGTLTQNGQSYSLTLSPADDSLSIPPPRPRRPEANPDDVNSPEATVTAIFEAFSAPGDEHPNWDRFRSLFLPEARLIYADHPAEGTSHYETGTVDEYIETSGRFWEGQDYREEVVQTRTERYANIAHVFFTYEGREPADAAEPTFRGVESAQLWHDGSRWWVVSLMWQSEREVVPIPDRYEK